MQSRMAHGGTQKPSGGNSTGQSGRKSQKYERAIGIARKLGKKKEDLKDNIRTAKRFAQFSSGEAGLEGTSISSGDLCLKVHRSQGEKRQKRGFGARLGGGSSSSFIRP